MATRKKRHSEPEIAAKLKEAAALVARGQSQREIARALGISVMTFHRWRKSTPPEVISRSPIVPAPQSNPPIEGLSEHERIARIAHLQEENARLRTLVTDLLLEKMRLEEEIQARPIRGPRAPGYSR